MPPKEKQHHHKDNDFSLKETSPVIGGGRNSTSTIALVQPRHFLYVRIVRAKLNPADSDAPICHRPFIELGIGGYKAATRVLQAPTHNPEWNQVFAFAKDNRLHGNILELILKDAGPPPEEESSESKNYQPKVMGRVYFEMGDVPTRFPPDSPLAPQWYKLDAAGELMAAVWIGNQADDAYSIAWHSDMENVGENVTHTRSKIYHSPRLWYLRIELIGAQDLVFPDRNNHPRGTEVYVRAMLGHMILKSRISPDRTTSNSGWNEELVFVAAEPFDDPLILIVEDRISGGSNIGRSVIPLESLERRLVPVPATGEKWINLEKIEKVPENGTKVIKFGGRLHLRAFLDGVYHVFDEPTYYSSDLRAISPKLWPERIGILELGILKAENLVPMKSKEGGRGSTDAYCVAKYGQKWVRTNTVIDSFAPSWNEQYYWDVYDPYTVITIGVFDNSQIGGNKISDPRIGKVRIRLSTLETDRIYTLSYPLIVLQPNGVKKTGELHLAVKFTSTSLVNLLQTYAQPLFPRMHYINPMSVYHLDSLRAQARHIISARLGRADPPLRREVVEYMLDSGANVWSLRKGKVNMHRLLSSLSFLSAISKAFDSIREWNNPSLTLTVYSIFLILVYFPQLILPCVFITLFAVGILGYPQRPRHPPHMDVKLSQAEDASADELDEEFDTFPSSVKQGEVLRSRYDRLRGIGGRVMMMVGDLATQMERVHCLLSWRDPRATVLFLMACVVCCSLVYVFPVRYVVILGGSYVIRPPRMRMNGMPCLPHNFLRRLPSNMDSLL